MKRASVASIALVLASLAGTGMAAPCFLPTEIEADQAIRLRTSLLIVSQQCKDPTYSRFIERNGDTLAAYEQLLQERFERDRGPDALATYLTQIESAENERAARTPSYCADAFELVKSRVQQEGFGPEIAWRFAELACQVTLRIGLKQGAVIGVPLVLGDVEMLVPE